MTEPTAGQILIDLVKPLNVLFGDSPILYLFGFTLIIFFMYRILGAGLPSFDWINFDWLRPRKPNSISFHKRLMIKLGLAEVKDGKG